MTDVSILIVHYNPPLLLRQTLLGIRRAAPQVRYEVIVVDNNPACRVEEAVRREFPEVRVLVAPRNLGFGAGMNLAIPSSRGRYLFVFNPDIAMTSGSLEELVRFMDASPTVGMCGPQLLHPDGSVQASSFRFMDPEVIAWRRLPGASRFPRARRVLDAYVMADWDHADTREVDYLLGASMFARREAVDEVGGFDPAFFVY